jgi:pSer/pThr/pTyr-binding forkhead associated (FHA) protein
MLVVLEAVAGPIQGRRIEIRAGSIVRLGRTAKSDYAIGEDSYLSGQHFAVEYDGSQCRVRDLGSSNGTFVNGDRVTEKIVKDGDSLVAGGSTFTVHVDASPAAAASANASVTRVNTAPTVTFAGPRSLDETRPVPVNEGRADWAGFSRPQLVLLNALYQGGDNVYAVLVASRDSRLPALSRTPPWTRPEKFPPSWLRCPVRRGFLTCSLRMVGAMAGGFTALRPPVWMNCARIGAATCS